MREYILILLVSAVIGWSPEIISSRISNIGYQTTLPTTIEFSTKGTLTYAGGEVVSELVRTLTRLGNHPVVVLLHQGSHVAGMYMKNILNDQRVRNDFWLMNVNSSGSTGILAKTSSDAEKFHELLKASKTESMIGYDNNHGTAVFFGILKAIRELPRGSGILVFVDRKIIDEDLGHLVFKEITEKNIKLFTVWHGLHPTLSGEEKLLQEITLLSHGKFLVGNYEKFMRKDYIEKMFNRNDESIIAHMENVFGMNTFDIPVDAGVTAIRITMSEDINAAHCVLPDGYLVDLVNTTSVETFSIGSYAVKADGVHEIQLDTAQKSVPAVVGMWRLQIDADVNSTQGYNFSVFIQNNLVLTTEMVALNKNQGQSYSFKLGLKGPFYSINNITLRDKHGLPTESNFDYQLIEDENYETMESKTVKNKVINVTLKDTNKPLYIEVNGKDIYGNKFVRMNYVIPSITINRKLQPISVETSVESQLLVYPNQQANIYFEVTNNLPQAAYVNFICRDARSYLYRMTPLRSRINAHETIQVTLVVIAGQNIGEDLITFTANSNLGQFQKSALLKIEFNKLYDSIMPHLWYSFREDCSNVLLGKCENGYWRIEVTAQDKESGLKRVMSNPPRLYFPQGYVTGTREMVIGYFSGSCCQPNIKLVAIDMINNRVSFNVHAYYTSKGIGIIIGIILLILLFIIIIVAIFVSILKCGQCRRKQKASVDLPTTSYRGPVNSASTRRY